MYSRGSNYLLELSPEEYESLKRRYYKGTADPNARREQLIASGVIVPDALTPCPDLLALPIGEEVYNVSRNPACDWEDDVDVYPLTGDRVEVTDYT